MSGANRATLAVKSHYNLKPIHDMTTTSQVSTESNPRIYNRNTAWARNSELLVPNPKLRLRVKDVDFEAQQIIVRGNIQGAFRRWDEQGTLTEEIELKGGQPDGLSKAYFPSGFLKTQVTLQNGKVVDQKFWKDGEYKETASAKPGLVSRK